MRELKTSDIFAAMRIIDAAHLSDEVKYVGELAQKGKMNIQQVGMELVIRCLEKLSGTEAERAFYVLIAGIAEMDPKEIADMNPFKLFALLKRIPTEACSGEDAKAFFTSLAGALQEN